jgi:hypothetical protein
VRKILALTVCLMFPCLSLGQCRTVYSTSYAASTYVAPTYYQTPALVAVLPAIFVPTASYTVGVSAVAAMPTAQAATMPKTDQIVSADVGMQMLAELKAMRAESKAANAEIRSMLGGKPMPIGPPKAAIDPVAEAAIAVLKKPLADTNVSCATCHRPGGKNGGLTFFDDQQNYVGMGKDDKEADEQALAMAKKVSAEKVCPKAPAALTGADKETVLKALPPLPVPKKEDRPQGFVRPQQNYLAIR